MKIFKTFLVAFVTIMLFGAVFLISSEIKKSSYKNSKKFGVVWCPYGAVTSELNLLHNNTYYCELVGSIYFGEYTIKEDKIYFWSEDRYKMGICKSYTIIDKSKKSFKLKPASNNENKEMYGIFF